MEIGKWKVRKYKWVLNIKLQGDKDFMERPEGRVVCLCVGVSDSKMKSPSFLRLLVN